LSVEKNRRPTLIARRQRGDAVYHHDVVMQGEKETVFFDV
jgi:protocatechuate 3,4-dioxygenase alpha subunit